MRTIILCIILGVAAATASDQLDEKDTKRFLVENGLTSSQQSQIQSGFNAAKHLLETMDKFDFAGVTGALIGSMSSFLGALGPFVGLVLSLVGGDSPELQALKKLFTEVENRFDQVDVQFAQLRRQVAFVPTQVHFTDLEANINAVQQELNTLAKVTNTAGYKYETGEFKKTFDRTYESSGIKLYNGVLHGGLTTGGIFHEFMVYSTYDRRETQRFMIGTLNLLMRAAALEMTYARLNNDPNQAVKSRDWQNRFTQFKNKMIAIDNEIVNNYHNQMVNDVNTFATQHPKGGLSNTDFSNQLYSKVTTKYYWRDWLVIVSAVYGSDKFVNHACELNQHDNHGRSIVVASVDKTKTVMNKSTALHILNPLKLDRSFIGRPDLKRHYVCVNSNDGYSQLPDSARNHCNTYAAAGVICTQNTDIHIHASSNRYYSHSPHKANLAYLFG